MWEGSHARTESSRIAIASAEQEARKLDDNHVGTEHIVLGLLAQLGSQAATALTALGVSRTEFLLVLNAEEGTSPVGDIPMTPRAIRILELSIHEAGRLGDEVVGTAHLLLGVVGESLEWLEPGPHHLRSVGERLGFTLEDVRQAAVESRAATEP